MRVAGVRFGRAWQSEACGAQWFAARLLAALLLPSCSGTPEVGDASAAGRGALPDAARREQAAPVAPIPPSGAPLEGAVATVDGTPIGAFEAFRLLLLSVPDDANNAVRQLVLDRLAAGEAAAQGITVPTAASPVVKTATAG